MALNRLRHVDTQPRSAKGPSIFRLAHISDIHLATPMRLTYRQLASKRVTGYINWHRNRSRLMFGDTLDRLVTDIKAHAVDHVVITGDLVNLGHGDEFTAARVWLDSLGSPEDHSVVPGNHDAYVPDALAKALSCWNGFLTGDDGRAPSGNAGFPYLRVRGPAAIIGVSSAVATAPFLATGRVGGEQAARLRQILDDAGRRGLFRVILIHHPPVHGAAEPHKRMFGITRFQRIVRESGAELVLHGHTHRPQRHVIGGRNGVDVPVVGVPAASQSHGGKEPASAWNMIEIAGAPGAWTCRLTERGLTGPSGLFAVRSSMTLHAPAQSG